MAVGLVGPWRCCWEPCPTPASDRPLYLLGQQKMATAAAATDSRARAEQNTRHMLESMLGSLGFTNVTVDLAPSPA